MASLPQTAAADLTCLNLLKEVLQTFGQNLHSKVPLKLSHALDFREEGSIMKMAKTAKKQVWKDFMTKLAILEDPDEDAVGDCIKEFGAGVRRLIDECISKHKAFKENAETLMQNYIDDRCKKLQKSFEEFVLGNPELDVKSFFQTEKLLSITAFQEQWSSGNKVFSNKQKRKLMKSLEQLEKEMVEKQRTTTTSLEKTASGSSSTLLDQDGMNVSMSVSVGPCEPVKVKNEVFDNDDDESDPVLAVSTSWLNLIQPNDHVIDIDVAKGIDEVTDADQSNCILLATAASPSSFSHQNVIPEAMAMTEMLSGSGARKRKRNQDARKQSKPRIMKASVSKAGNPRTRRITQTARKSTSGIPRIQALSDYQRTRLFADWKKWLVQKYGRGMREVDVYDLALNMAP